MNWFRYRTFLLVNTSRRYLKKLLSTSEIPPGLVISSPLTDLENRSMLLFPRTVYCNAQYSEAAPLHIQTTRPTHSELTSLETHEPENTIARPWPTVDLPSLAPSTRTRERLQRPNIFSKIHENNSALSTSHIYLICEPIALRSLDATVLVILRATLTPTHSQRVPSLLEQAQISTVQTSHY